MIAGIFPGDGSEYSGMSELIETCAVNTINTGINVKNIDAEIFKSRLNAQISVYTVSTLLWDKFQEATEFSAVSGHSLGFYAALYASGVISRNDGIEIIKKAHSAIHEVTSEIQGGMTAIIGLKWYIIDDICKNLAEVHLANINSATQVVISGSAESLEAAEKAAIEEGALRIERLSIEKPLHSPLLNGISDVMRDSIRGIHFRRPQVSVVNHVCPEVLSDVEKIKDVLCNQLTQRVLWRDAVLFMHEQGFKKFIEVGPSDVLSKLVKWVLRDAVSLTSKELLDKNG